MIGCLPAPMIYGFINSGINKESYALGAIIYLTVASTTFLLGALIFKLKKLPSIKKKKPSLTGGSLT
jgi:sulfite exporter TauE/SafE